MLNYSSAKAMQRNWSDLVGTPCSSSVKPWHTPSLLLQQWEIHAMLNQYFAGTHSHSLLSSRIIPSDNAQPQGCFYYWCARSSAYGPARYQSSPKPRTSHGHHLSCGSVPFSYQCHRGLKQTSMYILLVHVVYKILSVSDLSPGGHYTSSLKPPYLEV